MRRNNHISRAGERTERRIIENWFRPSDLDFDLVKLNILPPSVPSRGTDKDCITLRNLCLRLPLAIISARPFKYRKLRCAWLAHDSRLGDFSCDSIQAPPVFRVGQPSFPALIFILFEAEEEEDIPKSKIVKRGYWVIFVGHSFNENKIRRGKFHVHVFEASIFGERVRSISQEFARN